MEFIFLNEITEESRDTRFIDSSTIPNEPFHVKPFFIPGLRPGLVMAALPFLFTLEFPFFVFFLLCFLLDRPSLLVGCILIFIVIIEKKSGFQGFKGDFFLKKLAFLPFFSICLITRSIPCVCQENLLHFAVN